MPKQITGEELYRLNKTGQSYANIAQQYGITRGKVAGIIDRHKKTLSQSEIPLGRKTEFVQSGNEAVSESVGRIKTLDQLIEACSIDLTNWKIDRYTVNKWEVGRKASTKDLTYEDGIINGYVFDNGGINIEPLYQVKAWLSRINPEPIKLVLHPINVMTSATRRANTRDGIKIAIILPDPQFGFSTILERGKHSLLPFHDRRAIDVALQIIESIQPDKIVWLGDVNDFTMFTDKFIRKPEFYFNTQPMLVEASWVVAKTKNLCEDTSVLEGNHEDRVSRMMMIHLLDAYGLKPGDLLDAPAVMSIDNLIGYSRMGVNYINSYPDGEVWINDNIKCVHGNVVRGGVGATAKATINNEFASTIFGHIHRIELSTKTIRTRAGTQYTQAFSPGCLCHIDGRVPGATGSEQWQQGIGVIYYDDLSSTFVPVPIHDGRAIFNNIIFEGVDYVKQLCEDTQFAFI